MLDRFGRSLRHLVEALGELKALGVAFVSLRDNLDLQERGTSWSPDQSDSDAGSRREVKPMHITADDIDGALLSYHARRALHRMRRRPTLVCAFWEKADLFPL